MNGAPIESGAVAAVANVDLDDLSALDTVSGAATPIGFGVRSDCSRAGRWLPGSFAVEAMLFVPRGGRELRRCQGNRVSPGAPRCVDSAL